MRTFCCPCCVFNCALGVHASRKKTVAAGRSLASWQRFVGAICHNNLPHRHAWLQGWQRQSYEQDAHAALMAAVHPPPQRYMFFFAVHIQHYIYNPVWCWHLAGMYILRPTAASVVAQAGSSFKRDRSSP